MIIDSHTHFYDPSRPGGVPWPQKDSPLHRTVLPDHFREVSEGTGVLGTVIVEASPILEDNQWILDLAENDPSIVGFVGNLDLFADGFTENLDRFAGNSLFCGIRARGFAESRLLEESEIKRLEVLASKNLALDLLARTESLGTVEELARTLPNLSIVLDHVVHVTIDGGTPDPEWRAGLEGLSAFDNVNCKVSALPENASTRPAPTDPEFYRRTIEFLMNTLGSHRLLWGSNWPVCELASDYSTALGVVESFLSNVSASDRENVLYRTSQRVYGWNMDRLAGLGIES